MGTQSPPASTKAVQYVQCRHDEMVGGGREGGMGTFSPFLPGQDAMRNALAYVRLIRFASPCFWRSVLVLVLVFVLLDAVETNKLVIFIKERAAGRI